MVFFEGMSPIGHILFNRFLIETLNSDIEKIYLGKSVVSEYQDTHQNIESFNDSYQSSNRIISFIGFIVIALKVLLKTKIAGSKKICFLSYDLPALFIISYFGKVLGIKIFVFEHNTIPNRLIKYFFQFLCFRFVHRICFTTSAEKIYLKMNQKVHLIRHPLLNRDLEILKGSDRSIQDIKLLKENYKYVVFCPGAQSPVDKIKAKAQEYPNMLFVVKTKEKIIKKNILTSKYFSDYYGILAIIDFIYLPFNYGSRISGPFYEGVVYEKKSIMGDCELRKNLQGDFSDYVLLEEKNWNKFQSCVNSKIDISKYNEISKMDILNVFES